MNFSEALELVKVGGQVSRRKWNRKGLAIYLVDNKFNNICHIEFRDIGGARMYAASSEDLLAEDWEVVE